MLNERFRWLEASVGFAASLSLAVPAQALESLAAPPSFQVPVLEFAPEAPYPDSALTSGLEGVVVLKVTIGTDGAPKDPEVVESLGAPFDAQALDLLSQFRFVPAQRDGKPVPARILLPIRFARSAPATPESPADGEAATPAVLVLVPASAAQPEDGSIATSKPSEAPVEVQVRGELSDATRLEKSADAVTIVRLQDAKKRSADMADVLSRTPGVVVRRSGGLGSDVRFSINGLYGSAVRLFIDGVPLEMSGFPRNAGAISVNLIDHIEIYRGVVPLRLAADALGGAMNFVTDKTFDDRVSVSYSEGSFGTNRATGLAQYRHRSNFVFRATGYADRAQNDYLADVEVADTSGRLSPAQVRLNNNEYKAAGGSVEVGVIEKRWADRLLFRGFYSASSREYGHNLVMSVPYGEVRGGDTSGGGQVLYEVRPSASTRLEHITNFSHLAVDFLDVSEWVYDWYGKRIRERRVPGEIESKPYDQTLWDNMVFSRTLFEWSPLQGQFLLFNVTPKFTTRTGDERRQTNPQARDRLNAKNDLVTVIAAVGHEWNALKVQAQDQADEPRRGTDYRVQNILNLKGYFYGLRAEEPLPQGLFRSRNESILTFGLSDSIRFSIDKHWSLKASYEYATRLPDSWEVFGDGAFVLPNLDLQPEVSHNLNFGPLFDARGTASGDWVAFVNGGLRDSDRMIVLLGNERFFSYQNVYRALTLFGEGGLSWTSKGRYISLDASVTANDTRNQSDSGVFAEYRGDQIPNRPPLVAGWAARMLFSDVFLKRDRIEPFYQGRFSSWFYRSWESQGLPEYKDQIGNQVWQDVGITYVVQTHFSRIANTFEVQNLTNERLYENFGQQRPGRAFYWKITGDFN